MTPETRIAVIGAGSWGTTMASLLCERFAVMLWAREPEVAEAISVLHENPEYLPGFELPPSLHATASVDEALRGSTLAIIATPTQYVRGVAEQAAPFVTEDSAIVSLAKGIERASLMRPSEILRNVLGHVPPEKISVLSGPNLAREVMAGQPSATVVASSDPTMGFWLQSILNSDHFRVYASQDVVGCEIGGAVKNLIAIAAGVADGLAYGWNTRAALITRGLAELTRLGTSLGGEPLTFLGLAGNGDLIATCSSNESRNHRVGVELGKGRLLEQILDETKMIAEGVASAPAVLALAERHGVEMPVSAEVAAVLSGDRTAKEAVVNLMGRRPTTELHDLAGKP